MYIFIIYLPFFLFQIQSLMMSFYGAFVCGFQRQIGYLLLFIYIVRAFFRARQTRMGLSVPKILRCDLH